jgi:hypothetical protein
MTSSANIQKNTLEVKVELIDPPQSVSPEMLVTTTFLAPVIENPSQEATESDRMFIPSQLLQSDDSGASVWIVDAEETAQRRGVEVGGSIEGGLIEIKSGLRVTDKLIVSGVDRVTQGSPVRVTGDDQTLGVK